MKIEKLDKDFCVCQVESFSQVNLDDTSNEFLFISKTNEENSLVCSSDCVPKNTIKSEYGWCAFRIKGTLDFSLVGILAKISTLLADKGIAIYVISTFNTDYVLVKKENYDKALLELANNGYVIL